MWNPNATTISNVSLVGTHPLDVFVDVYDKVYVPDQSDSRLQVWSQGNVTLTRTILTGGSTPYSIFVALNGDIYVGNGASNYRVDKWPVNATTSTVAMNVSGSCFDIFIDINDYIYCSMDPPHQVVKTSLHNGANTSIIVAGIGVPGTTSDALYNPRGIFVDMNLNLYVADCSNDRVQFFRSGELNGSTIVINGSNTIFILHCPSAVVLDIDDYLFITDAINHRILGSGPLGFRCVAGCTGTPGTASDQLNTPHSLSFDSYGNLFVIENGNNRLQKFFLLPDLCGEFYMNKKFSYSSYDC